MNSSFALERRSNIYEDGAVANIAAFHGAISKGDVSNPTVAPSVRSTLVSVLGRNAAYATRLITWDEINADEQRLTPKLDGLRG